MPDQDPPRQAVDGERTVLLAVGGVVAVLALFLLWRLIVGFDGVTSFFAYVAERPGDILARTWEHTLFVLLSVGTATAISVPLGVAIIRSRPLRNIALTIAGVLLTVPSLAFFAILIPVVGLGFMPPFIALTIYALLPILRNTITGLDAVDPAVDESARGMGLSRVQRITKVQLPLAWPVILTGIRVATILNTSIAAIAVLVGAGGLGDYIQNGLNRIGFPNSVESIWTGTIFTILLALVFERGFALLARLTTSKGIR